MQVLKHIPTWYYTKCKHKKFTLVIIGFIIIIVKKIIELIKLSIGNKYINSPQSKGGYKKPTSTSHHGSLKGHLVLHVHGPTSSHVVISTACVNISSVVGIG
jgi:hypothetical protein